MVTGRVGQVCAGAELAITTDARKSKTPVRPPRPVMTILWSVRLRAGKFHHLGPLLGLVGEMLCERRRRTRQHGAAKLEEACLDFRILERGVDLAIEFFHDLGRR